jgi:peroxiredoxin
MEARIEKREQEVALWGLGIALAVLLLVILGLWLWTHRPPSTLPGMQPGEQARMWALADLDGGDVKLFDGQQGVVLCFFTLSCPGCVGETEAWRELTLRGRERHVRVFLVTAGAPPREIQRYVKANGVEDLAILHDPTGKLFERFHIVGVPEYLYFDRYGRLLYRSVGDSAPQGFTPQQRAETIFSMLPKKDVAGNPQQRGKAEP